MNNLVQASVVGQKDPSYNWAVNSNKNEADLSNFDFVRIIRDSISNMDSSESTDKHPQGKLLGVEVESGSHFEKSNLLGMTEETKLPLMFGLEQIPQEFLEEFLKSISGESINPDSEINTNSSITQANEGSLTNLEIENSGLIPDNQKGFVNQTTSTGLSGIELTFLESGLQAGNIQVTEVFPLSSTSNETDLTNLIIDASQDNLYGLLDTTGTAKASIQAVGQEFLSDSFFLALQQGKNGNQDSIPTKDSGLQLDTSNKDNAGELKSIDAQGNPVPKDSKLEKGMKNNVASDKSTLAKESTNSASDKTLPKNLNFLLGKDPSGEIQNLLNKVAEKQMNLAKAIGDLSLASSQKSENNVMNLVGAAKSSLANQTLQFNSDVEKNHVLESKKVEYWVKETSVIPDKSIESVKTGNQNSQQSSQNQNKTDHSVPREVKVENPSEKDNNQQGKTVSSSDSDSTFNDQKPTVESNTRASQNSLASTIAEDNSGLKMMPNTGKAFVQDSGFQRIIKGTEADFSAMKNSIQNFDEKDVVNQVLRRFSMNVRNQSSEFFMKLEPEFLGSVRFRVHIEGDNLSARVFTNTLMAKEVIEKNAHVLTNALSEQGIRVEKFQVEVSGAQQSDDFSSFGQKNQNGSGQENEIFNKYPRNEFYADSSAKTDDESQMYQHVRQTNGKALIDIMI